MKTVSVIPFLLCLRPVRSSSTIIEFLSTKIKAKKKKKNMIKDIRVVKKKL